MVPGSGHVFGPELQFLADHSVAFAVEFGHNSVSSGAQPSVSTSQPFPGSHIVNMSHSLFCPLIRKQLGTCRFTCRSLVFVFKYSGGWKGNQLEDKDMIAFIR